MWTLRLTGASRARRDPAQGGEGPDGEVSAAIPASFALLSSRASLQRFKDPGVTTPQTTFWEGLGSWPPLRARSEVVSREGLHVPPTPRVMEPQQTPAP